MSITGESQQLPDVRARAGSGSGRVTGIMTKKAARTVHGTSRGNAYRGCVLVNVCGNYYVACKGPRRVAVGSQRHGDINDLVNRFHAVVDVEELREEHE